MMHSKPSDATPTRTEYMPHPLAQRLSHTHSHIVYATPTESSFTHAALNSRKYLPNAPP